VAARTDPTNTNIGIYTKVPSITVTKATAQGAAVSDPVERDADMALWDTTANCYVAPENTSVGVNQ